MADEIAVVGGIDTHADLHQAAVIDSIGRHLATERFETTPKGYQRLLEWLRLHGEVLAVGVEGTGAYGAEIARFLTANEITVIEVDRPDRKARRDNGKSDPIDAYAAATAVLSGRACGTPKARNGIVEAIRALRVVRKSAVKARTQTINQIRTLVVTAPSGVRDRLRGLSTKELVDSLARSRPAGELADPACSVRIALRRLARRYQSLDEEIKEADQEIRPLVIRAAPKLIALPGVGPETAGQLLASAGDNPDRLRSEAAFAHLCGAAPVPASSGRTNRHRLNRGGDRQANNALHTIVLVRMKYDQRTRDYVARRTAEGLVKKDIIRCLKRFVAREIYRHLPRTIQTTESLPQTA
ncbi:MULTISPECIES: IS110 family transposase [Kitasatospora]|uniref:IS110 family transposase n=1 Tax=Kitasatospora TaxID=2063 RepID=UPI001DD42F02|nr:IS110 family transposase [Kitasatospora aureofaciens]HJD84162.1 IS110 family transposase [Kitasatospora aureofaciens]